MNFIEENSLVISLDLETSGLEPGRHVPLSIGAVSYFNVYVWERCLSYV